MNVLVTREKEKYKVFAEKLESVGLTPFALPMIECVPVSALIGGSYDYCVFTSINSVKYFLPHRGKISCDKLVAVGPSTAKTMAEEGLFPEIVPQEYSSDGLKAYFADFDLKGKTFLFPGAQSRAGDFHKWLESKGAKAHLVTTYTTNQIKYDPGYIQKFLKDNDIHVVTFASPSAAEAMLSDLTELSQQIVCIGRTTADKVRLIGFDCRYPDDFSLEWMIKLIKELG